MSKSETTGVNVYPVFAGPHVQFIPGVPAVPRLGITQKEARELTKSGAFTDDPSGWEAAQAAETERPKKRKPQPPPEADSQTDQDPPDGGSSDSVPEEA